MGSRRVVYFSTCDSALHHAPLTCTPTAAGAPCVGQREPRRRVSLRAAIVPISRVFHEFAPPPSGGGNQFLAGLVGELRRRGLEVEVNRISGETPACLFNSFNFDDRRLRRFARAGCRMVHRVDGPIGVYRGFDDGTDRQIAGSQPRSMRTRRSSSRVTASRSTESSASSCVIQLSFRMRPTRRSSTRMGALRSAPGRRCGSSRRAGRTTRERAPTSSPGSSAVSTPPASR